MNLDEILVTDGIEEGLLGQTYAFPTVDKNLKPLTLSQIQKARTRFYKVVEAHPELTFYLTKVGCSVHDENRIKKMFINAPNNVKKPGDWL